MVHDLVGTISWQNIVLILWFIFWNGVSHFYVFIGKPSVRSLKKIDYIWLGFACLGLVSAVGEQKRLLADRVTEYAANYSRSAAGDFKDEAKEARWYACDIAWTADEATPAAGKARYQAKADACNWFTLIYNGLEEAGPSLEAHIETMSLEPPEPVRSAWFREVESLSKDLKRAQSLVGDYHYIRTVKEKRDFEVILLVSSPYLLALALAIRIAKVTGELRLAKQ